MDPTLSRIKCLKMACFQRRLDRIWNRSLRLLRKAVVPFGPSGEDFLAIIHSGCGLTGVSGMPQMVVEYLDKYVTRRVFVISDATPGGTNVIRVDGTKRILSQLENGAPAIATEGFIQVAFSKYAERFLLDVKTGEVMVCRSPMLSSALSIWSKGGSAGEVGEVVRGCADYTFDNLVMMFWCFENPDEDDATEEGDSTDKTA